jgi:hypothetical protein
VDPVEYVFRIDAFTPETMPMARLAEYLGALAKLLGHTEHTHFVRLEAGSAKLVHQVDAVDAPKVDTRLNGVRVGNAPKDALQAQRYLEELLVNDNAVATLTHAASGEVVLPFVGRERPKQIVLPAFRENTTLQGQIVRIGGKDETAHAALQDGDTYYAKIQMKRSLARQLAPHLYGQPVRLLGNGKFARQANGVWEMIEFRVDRFELLEDRPIGEALDAIRSVPGNGLMELDAYRDVTRLRDEGHDDL